MSAPQTPKAVAGAPHGTLAGVQTWGFRCMLCKSAKAATTVTIGPGGAVAGEGGS